MVARPRFSTYMPILNGLAFVCGGVALVAADGTAVKSIGAVLVLIGALVVLKSLSHIVKYRLQEKAKRANGSGT